MNKENIESLAAKTILQQTKDIQVGNKTYRTAPPSTATLILASEAVSRLPHIKMDDNEVLTETLANAKDCHPLGEIGAILILGAKGLTEVRKSKETVEETVVDTYLFGLIKRPRKVKREIIKEQTIDRKAELAAELLQDLTPSELVNLITRLLNMMQVGDFFGLTTFLCEVNLLRQTKVEN